MRQLADSCSVCHKSLTHCDGRRYVYGLPCCTQCSHHTSRLQPGEPQQKGSTMVTKNAKADKPKRTMLTPAERVAKAEAELKALRQKAHERAGKTAAQLREHRAKLVGQIDERQAKVKAIDAELETLEPTATDVTSEDVELPIDDDSTQPED